MTTTPLLSQYESLERELDQIESSFYRCRGHSTVDGYVSYVPTEEGCLFALWDAWSRYLRGVVMTVASGPSMGLSGTTYVPAMARNESAVLAHLASNKNGQKYRFVNQEPNWHDEQALSDIVTVLGLPNAPTMIGAVTASSVGLGPIQVSSPLNEIRKARNFSAHKNWKTLQDVAAYAAPATGFLGLSHHLRARRSGVETFSEWKESIAALAAAAAQ